MELAALVARDFPNAGILMVGRAYWEFRRVEVNDPDRPVSALWETDIFPVLQAADQVVYVELLAIADEYPEYGERAIEFLRDQLESLLDVALANLVPPTDEVVRRIVEVNRASWEEALPTRSSVWFLEDKLRELVGRPDAGARAVDLLEEAAVLAFDKDNAPRLHSLAIPKELVVDVMECAATSSTTLHGAQTLREILGKRNDGVVLECGDLAPLSRFWKIQLIRGPEQKYWNAVLSRNRATERPGEAPPLTVAVDPVTPEQAVNKVEKYLRRHGVERSFRYEETHSGFLVFQNPNPGDLPGFLPVFYVGRATPTMFSFPGDADPELMRTADPANPDADPDNTLNRAWAIE